MYLSTFRLAFYRLVDFSFCRLIVLSSFRGEKTIIIALSSFRHDITKRRQIVGWHKSATIVCSFFYPLGVDVIGKVILVSLYALKVHILIINLISILRISLIVCQDINNQYVINL
jgi:hypothetical protein